jgi:endonuclease/exonuclease/phosphatase family metal-dependent hydrolase
MRRPFFPLLLLFSAAFAGCESSGGTKAVPVVDSGTSSSGDPQTVAPSAFVVANWNIEWFGSTSEGPTDEATQAANVLQVMKTMNADLWAVQEIVDPASLTKLASDLGAYEALPSSDASVEGGTEVYANPGEQKLGIVFRQSRLAVKGARLVMRDAASYFNGRAPMEVDLETKPGKTAITVVVLHAAPGTDAASYEKRKLGAAAIKAYLDGKPEGAFVMIAGDFNDGLEASSFSGQPSPYTTLVGDAAYAFTTKGLKSPRYPRVIDHQLVTDDLAATFAAGTAKVVDGDTLVTDFVDTTSDHDPVSVRYDLP